jgi:hypothetical protein
LSGRVIGELAGEIRRKKINISTVLAGRTLGIKELDDGVWLVSFVYYVYYDVGYIDLEQRTLQPVDDPYARRLSLVSQIQRSGIP